MTGRGDTMDDIISLSTERAMRSEDASAWTPRDVLIDTLKRLDAKEIKPDALIIVWRDKHGPSDTDTHFAQSGPDVHTALGLLSAAAMDVYRK